VRDGIKLKELSVEGMNALSESRIDFIRHLNLVSFCHHTQPNLLRHDSQQNRHGTLTQVWTDLINGISGCSVVEKKIHHLHILCSDGNV